MLRRRKSKIRTGTYYDFDNWRPIPYTIKLYKEEAVGKVKELITKSDMDSDNKRAIEYVVKTYQGISESYIETQYEDHKDICRSIANENLAFRKRLLEMADELEEYIS